jgi:hypothetical protein
MSRAIASIALAIVLFVISPVWAETTTVTIAWDPSPEAAVIGYQLYVGRSPGTYTETFDVGLATSFKYALGDGPVYYFAVASYAAGRLLGPLSTEISTSPKSNGVIDDGSSTSNEAPTNGAPTNEVPNHGPSSGNPVANTGNQFEHFWTSAWTIRAEMMPNWMRNEAPTVTVSMPTSQGGYTTSKAFVVLGGTATDDGGVTEVTWTTDRGHSGRASGTDNWIAGIPLKRGVNRITIRARDGEGRVTGRAIVVRFADRGSFTRLPGL